MKKMKRISLAAAILALIPLLILFCRVGGRIYGNQQKTDSFSYNGKMEQYQRGIPMGEMDLLEYRSYLDIPTTLVARKVSNVIALPVTIQYFTEQDGKKIPAFELSRGTAILWIPSEEFNDLYIGYGFRGYPTYDKGWRYARPFMLAGRQADVRQPPYYFVRTKELEAVAKAAFRSDGYLMKSVHSQGKSVEEAVFLYTRFIDNIFYEKGVFYSPDLVRQVWRCGDTVLLCLSAGFLFVSWLLRRRLYLCNKDHPRE